MTQITSLANSTMFSKQCQTKTLVERESHWESIIYEKFSLKNKVKRTKFVSIRAKIVLKMSRSELVIKRQKYSYKATGT